MNQVLRKEKKFLLTNQEFYRLKGTLDRVLHQDPHNGPLGYTVRSLYFDTVYDRDLFEKLEGIELRRKIRLRCYGPGDGFAMLEIKQKQGDTQLKRSLRLSREDAIRLTRGDYQPLLHHSRTQEAFALECYALINCLCYQPKVIVDYQRLAYIGKENKIRITFDQRVQCSESCAELFSPTLNLNPVLDLSAVVLEVKYNGFLLNYFQELLRPVDRSELSVSKYYLSRHTAYGTHL